MAVKGTSAAVTVAESQAHGMCIGDRVKAARDAGDSWTVIASALDTTRQAAQQRFGGN